MPEYPDIAIYVERLSAIVVGQPLVAIAVRVPFLVRTFDPPLSEAQGKRVTGVERLGKRIILALEDELFLVLHLMIAGRLRWRRNGKKAGNTLAQFAFPDGVLFFTEAGTTRRASLHLVRGRAALAPFDRGGLELFEASEAAFRERLLSENHTLKRALTDPRLFSGIGNAYSDEILHRARLSPLALTSKLTAEEVMRLRRATLDTLAEWRDRFRKEVGDGFPEEVTAFRPEMAVHGKYQSPCPDCGAPVQRIRYATNETDYCARCQTGGRLLADRAMSRLLKSDWPRSIDDLE